MNPTPTSNLPDESDPSVRNDFRRLFTKIKKSSPTSKVLFGSTFGWVTGLLVARVGKLVALSLGGAIILMQIAQQKDFVKINWGEVDESVQKVPSAMKESRFGKVKKKFAAALNFDTVLSSGFLGGFLIGLSTD